MNSNGVGVPPLCFFTKTFKKAGKEVWNSSFSFCPQPSWMHMNSFVQQGLKPEQHPKPQNVKTTSRREKLFHWFQGKMQSLPHVCYFKNRKLPKALNQMCSKSCSVTSFAQARTHKALSEQSRGSTKLRKIIWEEPHKKAVQCLCWTFSQNMKLQNPDAIGIKWKVSPQLF